jgi:hypothetical protein
METNGPGQLVTGDEAWLDSPLLPGTRLSWVRTGIGRHELRTAERQTVVSEWRRTISAGGKTFTLKTVDPFTLPGIPRNISNYRPGKPAHMRPDGQVNEPDTSLSKLLDETGTPILYISGNTIARQVGCIKFPGHRELRFRVQGTNRTHAIMTAADQDGNKVARYRIAYPKATGWRQVQITVHPDQELTDELTLAIALPAPWLHSGFEKDN